MTEQSKKVDKDQTLVDPSTSLRTHPSTSLRTHPSTSLRTHPERSRRVAPARGSGFYSRGFTGLEAAELETALAVGLENEVALMRVVMRRLFEQACEGEEPGLDEWSKLLGALGLASSRLATLLRTQKDLAGEKDAQASATISQALSEVVEEMKLKSILGGGGL